MRILGVDPGLKATGYGFVDHVGPSIKLVEAGTIEPKQKDEIQFRIEKIYAILSGLMDQYKPDVLVLEKLYAHSKHPTTASVMGHARGVVCLLCAQKRVELVEHSVKRIRKALTGNGNSTKVQTQRFVGYTLNIDPEKLTLDASDALALALGYIRMSGCKI